MFLRRWIAFFVILFLNACAPNHLDKRECHPIEWHNAGLSQGFNGRPPESLVEAERYCTQFNRLELRKSYLEGWRDGLVQYCFPEKGFPTHFTEQELLDACPSSRSPIVAAAWTSAEGEFKALEIPY